MSLKTFLSNIWESVSNLWKKTTEEVKKITNISIEVVNALKTINESTTGDIIALVIKTAIPGKADDVFIDALREKLKKILPEYINYLNLTQSISNIDDPNEQLKAILVALNNGNPNAKKGPYHNLCSLIIEALADGKITWSESIMIAEKYYIDIYTK